MASFRTALLATAASALSLAAAPAALANPLTFTNKTTTDGLGSNNVRGVYANGNTIYAATTNGLSISSNGGTSFTNYTQANNGLANNQVNGVYAIGSNIYAATSNGFSISTNGGLNWTTASTGGGGAFQGVFASGSSVYVASQGGVSISLNSGTS